MQLQPVEWLSYMSLYQSVQNVQGLRVNRVTTDWISDRDRALGVR